MTGPHPIPAGRIPTGCTPTESASAESSSGATGALVLHALRLLRRSALTVGLAATGLTAVVVDQYQSVFSRSFDSASMERLARNPAIRVLFGQPVALDDPGGFTVWRTGAMMTVLLATWAALVAIRVTRAEEEAGRWNLLLVGRHSLAYLTLLHGVVVAAVAMAIGAAVAGAMAVVGAALQGAVLYGGTVGLIGAGSAAWGTLVSQLAHDRRRASTIAMAGLGAAVLARMMADGVEPLSWMRWLSPFGLLTVVQPFAADRRLPLLVLAAAAGVFGLAAVVAGARRDVGAGLLTTRVRRRAHTTLLRSLPRFQLHRARGALLAWSAGIGIYFLVIGTLSSSVTTFLADNPAFAQLAARAGFAALTTVGGFLASLFLLLAIPLGLYATSRVGAGYADEEAGRLRMIFAAPVSPLRWFMQELLAAAGGTVLIAVGAGLAAWLGAVAVDAAPDLRDVVAGALNVLPVAGLSLGASLLALGWAPRAVLLLGALPVVGGFLLDVVGASLRWPSWLRRLSPYDHIRLVPYESVDWTGALLLLSVATALGGAGLIGYRRRDLRG